MRQALYRKYRPKTLNDVAGQEYVKVTLGNQLASGQIGHAYLFCGPKGTGKTTLARILARSVNCLELKNGVACGKCAMCQAFDNGQMIDLIEIDAASNRSIDNIRELIGKIGLAPSIGKYKIYVIDEAHQLTKEASNALLKTLEEPPSHAIFVLATTDPDKLLPTIVSRCQRFDFRYVALAEEMAYLAEVAKAEKIKISPDGLEFIARQSGGGMRDAMSLLEQASFIGGEITQETLTDWLGLVSWQVVYELTCEIIDNQPKKVLAKIDQLYHEGYDLNRLTATWVGLVRQILAVKLGNGERLTLTAEQINQLGKLADQLTIARIVMMMQELMWAGQELKSAVVPQVPLEIVVVKLTNPAEDKHDDSQPPTPTKIVETPKSDEPVVSPPASSISNVSLAELQEVWPKVLEQLRSVSPTLGGMLVGAQLDLREGVAVLKFAQQFHKEKMEQPASLKLLRGVLEELGYDCAVKCEVEPKAVDQPIDLQNVSEVFGGAS